MRIGVTRESRRKPVALSTEFSGKFVHQNKFGTVARALWPRKTAAELAWRAGVSERAAKYWLAGKRRPNKRALVAVISEFV